MDNDCSSTVVGLTAVDGLKGDKLHRQRIGVFSRQFSPRKGGMGFSSFYRQLSLDADNDDEDDS